jgi:beta-phosphoglucomutase-like phosphatase (HAD superfamily)
VDFFFEHLNLATWFDVENIAYDNGDIAGKPAPDLYLLAAKKLNLPPGKCIVIEDSISGIQSAHSAGIGHIIALGPKPSHKQFSHLEGVNAVIENLGLIQIDNLIDFE